MSTSFVKLVENKRKLIAKHQKELKALLAECKHENLEQKEYHYEGGYLDKAYSEYWNQCPVCGYKTKVTMVQHDWYG